VARATLPKQLEKLLGRVWPNHPVEKMGQEHMVLCPFCDSDKHKCAINPEKAVFQCWVCGERGNTHKILEHLVKLRVIRQSDMDSVLLKKGTDTSLSNEFIAYPEPTKVEVEQLWTLGIPCVFPKDTHMIQGFQPKDVMEEMVHKRVVSYLRRRGVKMVDITRYKLHFCSKLKSVYHAHIFFPALGEHGRELTFWTTRSTLPDAKPKSLHSGRKYSRFSAKQTLFNEHLVVDTTVALCEGPFDAHSIMAVTGIAACPLLGKVFHEYQLERLRERNVKRVYVCLDADAGNARDKIARQLNQGAFGMEVLFVDLKDGDPNDVAADELKAAFLYAKKAAIDTRPNRA